MTEAIEQYEFDRTGGALLVEPERAQKVVVAPSVRHRGGQARSLDQALQPRCFVSGESGILARKARRRDHSDCDRLAVKVAAVTGARFDRVADGVAEVQAFAQPAFALVGGYDCGFMRQ